VRDGDEMEVTAEGGRIVLTPAAEEPLPGEPEAIREGEEEFARGAARRLEEIVDRNPATKAAIAEGLADARAGRLSPPFDTAEEIEAWQKTETYKTFVGKV
jgi:hypothetical protein